MTLDPQVQALLDAVKRAGLPEMWELTPDQAREAYVTRTKKLDVKTPETLYRVEDRPIPGPARDIAVRLYRPRAAVTGERMAALVWFHGGGFVIGDLDTHDSACRRLAKESDAVIVAVDYRLAPEAKFPAAVEDAIAAVRWIALHAEELSLDPARLAVGGDSAGGNLAAVCALIARDDGFPKLAFQLLVYPCTAPEPETPSHRQFAEGHLLTRRTITWFYAQYLKHARDRDDFRFAPLMADDFSRLPPAFVVVAGHDPLRDEGILYATKLIEAGVDVTLVNMAGMIHGFWLMLGALDAASVAIARAGRALKAALRG
jgi:acetyl esterase